MNRFYLDTIYGKGYLVYGRFHLLFVSHILAAANDYDILFRIIASLITLQVIFTGLFSHKLSIEVSQARIPVLLLMQVGLCILGYEYQNPNLIFVILGVIVQYGLKKH